MRQTWFTIDEVEAVVAAGFTAGSSCPTGAAYEYLSIFSKKKKKS